MVEKESYRQVGTAEATADRALRKELAKRNKFPKRARTASIPSKFEITLLTTNQEKNGFGNRTFRFKDSTNDLPGPGQYRPKDRPLLRDPNDCPGTSQKGYGAFVSRTDRFTNHFEIRAASLPAPGQYKIKGTGEKPVPVPIFAKPKYYRGEEPLEENYSSYGPGPGYYKKHLETSYDRTERMRKSYFMKRKGDRVMIAPYDGPDHQYDIDSAEMAMRSQGDNKHMPFASMRSKSGRNDFLGVMHKGKEPGPGEYSLINAYYASQTDQAKKLRNSPAFMNVNLDRFGKHYVRKSRVIEVESAGPGWYAPESGSTSFDDPVGNIAAFKMKGERFNIPLRERAARPPGPAYYQPTRMQKKSYFLNATGKWV